MGGIMSEETTKFPVTIKGSIPRWVREGWAAGMPASHVWFQRWLTTNEALKNIFEDGHYDQPGSCSPPWDLLTLVGFASGAPAGCFVEVGVYKGGSAYQLMRLAKRQGRELYLYDTFAGMPACDPAIDTVAVGELADTSLEAVRRDLGEYPYMEACEFPWNVSRMPTAPVAFAHIDVDQYQAHIDVCLALAPLMAKGGIMWFDDVPELEGARKAVRDLFPAEAIRVEPNSKRWYVEFL
jgi:hypothetical protein